LRGMSPLLGDHPTAFAYLLGALERSLTPPLEVAVVGAPADPATDGLWREVTGRMLPDAVVLRATPGQGAERSPLLAARPLVDGKPTAYVCEHYACRQPVTTPDALRTQLDAALESRLA